MLVAALLAALTAVLFAGCGGPTSERTDRADRSAGDRGERTLPTILPGPDGSYTGRVPPARAGGRGTLSNLDGTTYVAPSPDEAAATAAWEAEAVRAGAAASFRQTFDYSLQAGTRPLSGKATLVHTPELSSLSLEPDTGEPLTLWLRPATTELLWCDTASCYSARVKAAPGEEERASSYQVAALLLVNLDPSALVTALTGSARSSQTLSSSLRQVAGTDARCSRVDARTGRSTVVSALRCWADGRIVLYETGGQSVTETGAGPADPPALPFPIDDDPPGRRTPFVPSPALRDTVTTPTTAP